MRPSVGDVIRGTKSRRSAHESLNAILGWSIILSLAAVVALIGVRSPWMALGAVAAVLVAAIVFVDGGRRDLFANHGWIPYAWVLLALAPELRFTSRDPLDTSVASAPLENFIEVGVYALVAALTIRARRLVIDEDRRRLYKGPIVLWPTMALASAVWSLAAVFTVVRALELFVPIGLAVLVARIWLLSPTFAAAIWRKTIRVFVGATTILVLIGFATGSWRYARFSWPGTHNGVVAVYVGIAFLILIAAGRSFLGLRTEGYVLRLVLFAAALFLGQNRSVLAGVLVALAVLFVWSARTHQLKSLVGFSYYAIATALLVLTALPQVTQYVLRGGTEESFVSLSERIPLWIVAVDVLNEANRWLIGFGYGSARVILPAEMSWAGNAHSSWIEILLSIGIAGPLFLAADLVFVARRAAGRRFIVAPAITLSILAILIVTSFTGETLVFPGVGFTMLWLIHVPVLTQHNSFDADASTADRRRGLTSVRTRRSVARMPGGAPGDASTVG